MDSANANSRERATSRSLQTSPCFWDKSFNVTSPRHAARVSLRSRQVYVYVKCWGPLVGPQSSPVDIKHDTAQTSHMCLLATFFLILQKKADGTVRRQPREVPRWYSATQPIIGRLFDGSSSDRWTGSAFVPAAGCHSWLQPPFGFTCKAS